MKLPRRVLVVTPSTPVAHTLLDWLAADFEVSVVATYAAAKAHLERRPDVVISALKLGDFNGLQLAIRAHDVDVPTLVLDVDDGVLQKDARQLGVAFFTSDDFTRARLLETIDALLAPVMALEAISGISWNTYGVGAGRTYASPRRTLMN